MANFKGLYSEADESGMRIQYLFLYELGTNIASIFSSFILLGLFFALNSVDSSGKISMQITILISSLAALSYLSK